MNMLSFEIADIEILLKISKTLAKNWSSGRPLRIKPSIREATGPGTNNVYSLNDLYLMALATELHKAGMATRQIQPVLDKLPATLFDEEPRGLVMVDVSNDEVDILVLSSEIDSIPLNIKWNRNWGVVQYFIDLKMLTTTINERIQELRSRQKWDGKKKARAMMRKSQL